jgi:hypothetical protein
MGRQKRAGLLLALAWGVPLLLSLIEGTATRGDVQLAFLSDPQVWTRFFLAVPLLVLSEGTFAQQAGGMTSYVVRAGIVPEPAVEEWRGAVERHERRATSRVAVIAALVVAVLISLLTFTDTLEETWAAGVTSSWYDGGEGEGSLSLAGMWSIAFSLPCYRYLAFLWIWRVLSWTGLLRALSRLPLHVQPGHPDGAGGLSVIGRAQASLVAVGAVFSIVFAGGLAHEILIGDTTFRGERATILIYVLIALAAIHGPLLLFSPRLLAAKQRGLLEYGELGADLSRQFRGRWLGAEPPEKGMLDTADPSAVADYAGVYEPVATMRLFPLGSRVLIACGAALAVPFVPLVLLEMPIAEVLRRLQSLIL